MSGEEAKFRQRRREAEVAAALAERLDGVAGQEELWASDQVCVHPLCPCVPVPGDPAWKVPLNRAVPVVTPP